MGGNDLTFRVNNTDVDPPTQVNNTGSTLAEGGTDTISNTELRYDDAEQSTANVTYTINSGPSNGQFELTTDPGNAVTDWTQAQVDAGQVVYVHDGSNTTRSGFRLRHVSHLPVQSLLPWCHSHSR